MVFDKSNPTAPQDNPTPNPHNATFCKSAALQNEIDHILFELRCCVNDLHGYRLQISADDIQQAELSMHKLQTLISFVKLSSQRKIAC